MGCPPTSEYAVRMACKLHVVWRSPPPVVQKVEAKDEDEETKNFNEDFEIRFGRIGPPKPLHTRQRRKGIDMTRRQSGVLDLGASS